MTDRPDAKELLEIARATLANELLPFLPPDKRLTGLMVSSALSMAARELATSLPALPTVTVADIRAGRHDADKPLYEALLAEARARALISNPKDAEAE
jgi:hypothetical protein